MDADTHHLLTLVSEVRQRQRRMDVAGGPDDLFALRLAERRLDDWIESLAVRHVRVPVCAHGIDKREHCPSCDSGRTRHKKK